MERKIEFSVGEFYHLYSRGVNKNTIFTDDADRNKFIKLLFACNNDNPVIFRDIADQPLEKIRRGETLVAIGAYCLMPNHFHILVYEKLESGISKFMTKFLTAYSMHFNKKHERRGPLFESRFRAEHADTDEYLKYLFSYIHLNPIKLIRPDWKEKGIGNLVAAEKYLANYKYSSYPDYIGTVRPESVILDRAAFPEYFETKKDLEAHIGDWLNFKDEK